MAKILVTGAQGQLGRSIHKLSSVEFQHQFTFADIDELDLSDSQAVEGYLLNHSFDVIINCAAYTAVDKAEEEVSLADAINHLAIKQLANIAQKQGSIFIHVSTDYVFNGHSHRPYVETDECAPQNVYGRTKRDGELAVLDVNPKGAIIRTSWVYSEFGHNFVKTMMRLGEEHDALSIIFDQIGTPTYAMDLAITIMAMVNQPQKLEQCDIYHFSNEGVASWFDFAQSIFELSSITCQVSPIETKAYPTPAQRPHYSVLNKAKIKQSFDLVIPYWKDALNDCLNHLSEQSSL